MMGFGRGGRSLAAAAIRRLVHPPGTLWLHQSDECLRPFSVISSFSYATLAKIRERKSKRRDDDELQWNDTADRHVPWPVRRREQRLEEKEKKKNRRRSFKLRSEKFLKPFTLDIFMSNRFVHATIMHRAMHKVVAVANTNAKEFRGTLPAYGDMRACWVIGKVLADRAKDADVYTVVYEPRRGEKLDARMWAIVDTLVDNGIALELHKS